MIYIHIYIHAYIKKEVIFFQDKIWPIEFANCAAGDFEFCEVHDCLGRMVGSPGCASPWSTNSTYTILTTSLFVARTYVKAAGSISYRLVHGLTLMEFTGWSSDMYEEGKFPSHEELTHFAGNAFNGFALMALMLSICCVWPFSPGALPKSLANNFSDPSRDLDQDETQCLHSGTESE